MIDLHTHSLLSDGVLVPSELARRAEEAGYRAIAITDHVDYSNIDFVIEGLVRVSEVLNKYWKIKVLPGVEITHSPVEAFKELTDCARGKGAKVVVGHGESPVEPVLAGTNRAAIEAGVDILAHPGSITEEDASLAKDKGVHLEITSRSGHDEGNKHVFQIAKKTGASLILCTDAHAPGDLLSEEKISNILGSLTKSDQEIKAILNNSEKLLNNLGGI